MVRHSAPRASRRARRVAAAALLLAFALPAPGGGAPRLEVSPDRELDPDGQEVTVRGSGYDTSKGVYVAWCVLPQEPATPPSPCGGGQNRTGSGQSAWVSSVAPPYGTGLAQPYGEGGTFEVRIHVSRHLDDEHDCFRVACAVVTRNDHTRSDDRSQDVFVRVTFRGQPVGQPKGQADEPDTATGTATGTASGGARRDATAPHTPPASVGEGSALEPRSEPIGEEPEPSADQQPIAATPEAAEDEPGPAFVNAGPVDDSRSGGGLAAIAGGLLALVGGGGAWILRRGRVRP